MADDEMPQAEEYDAREEEDERDHPRERRVHFGEATVAGTAESVAAGIAAGHIHIQDAGGETVDLPEASREAREAQERLVAEVEARRKLRSTVVPTDVEEVRQMLRQLGHPVTLFGEREMERRERLRKVLATMDEEEADAAIAALGPQLERLEEQRIIATELFYTEGGPELKQARLEIARFSLARARQRLLGAKRRRADPDEDERAEGEQAVATAKLTVNQSSEFGDERPISGCAFSPNGALLATVAWSGLLKLWSADNCQKQLTVKAHDHRITGVAWHPGALTEMPAGAVNLATGAADNEARLWSAEGKLLRALQGHTDRLGRIAWHPLGRHLGTASFDMTWRLWDVETGAALLEQEGHSRSLYTLAFHPDGSLAASGGLDANGRIWDMRTGRSILVLEGHVKPILAADFSPAGYLVATGSEDHTVRVWDLRKKRSVYTLPAHQSLVSQVRFEPNDGHTLLTAGYDNTAKLWGVARFQLVKTLAGHEGKIMGADVCPDGSGLLATVGYDRTIKLWAPDDAVQPLAL